MVELSNTGAYLVNGSELVFDTPENAARISGECAIGKEEAKKNTIAYGILESHNTSGNMDELKIKFDKLTSHDITFVGIIQTARASGLEKFPIPYVLTNCHNSLCAVGGTINEDDHLFGLSAAKKYGGVYVPPHQAVIHQYAREMLAECGKMILGSDSHTRYGAIGTMAMGEGGPELVKQLLSRTYDIKMPGVIAIYLTGAPQPGVGPQDIALAIIGEVFANGYVKNKVMEFVGPGVSNLSMDYRIASPDHDFIYGLPELNRRATCTAKHVANPGCFATCIQLGLLPLAKHLMLNDDIMVNAITGSTGAGVKPGATSHFSWRNNNMSVYKAFDHQHVPEIKQSLKQLQNSFDSEIDFIPYRGDFPRGIFATLVVKTKVALEEIVRMYEEYYAKDSFVHIVDKNIDLKQVVNTNKCLISLEKHGDKLLVVSAIDNLLKGASGQAVQNMNLMFGLDQRAGLRLKAAAF